MSLLVNNLYFEYAVKLEYERVIIIIITNKFIYKGPNNIKVTNISGNKYKIIITTHSVKMYKPNKTGLIM